MNAENFLKSINIELKSTTLVVHIDGHNRQPDLCSIMEMYANHKIKSIVESLNNIGIHIPNKISSDEYLRNHFKDFDIGFGD